MTCSPLASLKTFVDSQWELEPAQGTEPASLVLAAV
jgi:hypothetical protein